MSISIAVFSDVICPWCYVGKRRLERALDSLGMRSGAHIEWLPFELNPDMPEGGVERSVYRERKFGSERSALLDHQMKATGEGEGISFAFDRMLRTPNSRRAHMLIAAASRAGHADGIVNALFRAYFEEGRDIGDPEVLVDIATANGLSTEDAAACLEDGALRQQVVSAEQRAAEMQITSVPFFIVDRKWAISGAQSPEVWMKAIEERHRLGAA